MYLVMDTDGCAKRPCELQVRCDEKDVR